jgi:hypothetical protein
MDNSIHNLSFFPSNHDTLGSDLDLYPTTFYPTLIIPGLAAVFTKEFIHNDFYCQYRDIYCKPHILGLQEKIKQINLQNLKSQSIKDILRIDPLYN